MIIVLNYDIDTSLYEESASQDDIILVTKEYRTGSAVLVHQRLGDSAARALALFLAGGKKDKCDPRDYYLLRREGRKPKLISKNRFLNKLKKADASAALTERYMNYEYNDANNVKTAVSICISEAEGVTSVTVEFSDLEQQKNFIPPEWLKERK